MISYTHIQNSGAAFQITIEAPNNTILTNWLEREFGDKANLFQFNPTTEMQDPDLMIDESGKVIYCKGFSVNEKIWLYWLKKIAREIAYKQIENSYVGSINNGKEEVHVTSDDTSLYFNLNLEDSLKLRNHSPDGFSWGYSGSGPSQLALAILLHEFQDPYLAIKYYQEFKSEIISKFQRGYGFFIQSSDIREWLFSKVFDYNKIAEELIQELILCQRTGFVAGKHWHTNNLEQSLLDLTFHHEKEVDKLGFCKVKVSVTNKPDYIIPGWDLSAIYGILDDFNCVNGFVYSKSIVKKRIEFSTSYNCQKAEHKPEVRIVGSYKGGLFHISLEG